MKRTLLLIVIALLLLPAARPVTAQTPTPPARDPAFEQEVYDRLEAIDPKAVPLFKEATAAMDREELDAARRGYEQVLELAPDFPDALRRLAYVESGAGNFEKGIEYARKAYELEPSPYNQIGLANVLLYTNDNPKNLAEALELAEAAFEALPGDSQARSVLMMAAVTNANMEAVNEAADQFERLAPEAAEGHYLKAFIAIESERWDDAENELQIAESGGMAAELIEFARDYIAKIKQQPAQTRDMSSEISEETAPPDTSTPLVVPGGESGLLIGGGIILVLWLIGLSLLFGGGALLSRLTLNAVREIPNRPPEGAPVEQTLRSLYRTVIALTGLYFYLSIPILIILILIGGGALVYLVFSMGSGRAISRIGVALIIAILATLWAIVRSLFTRNREGVPGIILPREHAPRLWATLEKVAARIGTRPVDTIYLNPFPMMAVMERGAILRKVRGTGERCLILGLGALPGMTQGQFEAILAHEYGHFSNRDTAGGDLALVVRQTLERMAQNLARGGQATWYNPVWLFLNGYYRIFLRITLGASRLQEILADRYAVLNYGFENFREGLYHIVRQSLAFDLQVPQTIQEAKFNHQPCPNLYALPAPAGKLAELQDRRFEELLKQPTSPYDSHPALQERLELAGRVPSSSTGSSGDIPAWELLPEAETLQQSMTDYLVKNTQTQRMVQL